MQESALWQPSASIETLRFRAVFLAKIRDFFNQRGYLEVETPIMAQHGVTDVYLSNIQASFRGKAYNLQTSPEYHMKRLLAAGSGSIFQLARVFRDDELGRWHNPEFTMLEWYRLDIDHLTLLSEVEALLRLTLDCAPIIQYTYQQAFITHCGLDPFNTTIAELKNILSRFDLALVLPEDEQDIDQYLFLLMSFVVEPQLAHEQAPVAIVNFPPSQAALAQITDNVASRFEVYYQGVELANGFHELTCPKLQSKRFESDLSVRKQQNLPLPTPDTYLLQALEAGLPNCSGVALGIDRLLALALQKDNITEVLSFDFFRS
jgi:elongation factor P--(R)-beta-lysine ligase